MKNARLLIIEDEAEVREALVLCLESAGYEVDAVATGEEGREKAITVPGYDLILLDARLPGRDGFEVLRELREEDGVLTPVLMLTGLDDREHRLKGFELGADDYVTKPFAPEELLARVEAILRRSRRQPQPEKRRFRVGGLEVDLVEGTVTRDGQPVSLTDMEFRLLRYLILHRGRTVTREQLLREVWQLPPTVQTRTIDRHINALRKIMDGEDEASWPIQSVYGIGYRLVGGEFVD
ncbi:response regulator transcription factor [Rhodothermus profundi]|uniref:DNA-binding response regulator, OmpR family, contains REC and winged-helix (WHTH) domain n=1 Tax=Rhodothermus profundi TaxID=633813 RepID=A0A1M6VGL5_9BACT|nr:response regulator transcription factor [Rhodothermus profundi]SHK80416.1 DNA-binding response regulator, OmpR family, contains REC and winged-helix (wHTH) domain [Rhodothermus profundi]